MSHEALRVTAGPCSTAAAAALLMASSAAMAQETSEAPEGPVQQIEVTGRHYDNAVGSSDAASHGVIRAELLKSRPALRPGEVLEFVPGVIVTQHSGDGKANQYFLRGFNLDHGTDFATTVNGQPVNMPTHAHGHGYSDLNFLIPELVERVEYRKGPYFARNGDFSAAGSADIAYRTTLERPFAALTLGQRGYQRLVGAGSGEVGPGLSLLGALELQRNDGPWTVPEDLHKLNGVLTLSGGSKAQGFSASLMHYDAHWTSTDQIPQRLTDASSLNGRPFGRFDSLDPTDGGSTRRSSLSGEWHRRGDDGSATRVSAYAIDYRLKLFSNFTYALERPDQGDQFSQQDRRQVYGLNASHAFDHQLGAWPRAASSDCSCATTASASVCSTRWRAKSWTPRAMTGCAKRNWASMVRLRWRWRRGCAPSWDCARTRPASTWTASPTRPISARPRHISSAPSCR